MTQAPSSQAELLVHRRGTQPSNVRLTLAGSQVWLVGQPPFAVVQGSGSASAQLDPPHLACGTQ